MKHSLIIPVYNRPDEVDELLASLCTQTSHDFDVHIVEDGSDIPCRAVCDRYRPVDVGSSAVNTTAPHSTSNPSFPLSPPVGSVNGGSSAVKFPLYYYVKENGGPGAARNYGAERATGDYFIVLDSDVVLPPGYIAAIDEELHKAPADAFGGPDRAHPDFTPVQKAISYAMTSFFTTGGIRGGKKKLDRFYPRSFNMGVSRQLWQHLGGFRAMRFGEDIDFSYRICDESAHCRLFPEAWVWHKRRTDFRKFFRQVRNSGIARINLHMLHPGSMKLVHMLPALFTVGCIALVILFVFGLLLFLFGADHMNQAFGFALCELTLLLPLLYALLIFVGSSIQNRSLRVGFLSVPASFIQLIGYGTGFLSAAWHRLVMKEEGEHFDFENNQKFYK